jgi:predicted TIM-barrel fold metal-dependent hydrolase
MNLSVNFHIGFQVENPNLGLQDVEKQLRRSRVENDLQKLRTDKTNGEARAALVRYTIPLFMGNSETIVALLTSDLCTRFPKLNFVSVESGFGYVPYLLEALDWQWKSLGAHAAISDRLLPSEYFKRQCYGTFWFEKTTLPLLSLFPNNFMFSTDFPHPTSLSPGPASPAENPFQHAQHAFAGLPHDIVRKALHDNATRLYHLT